MSDYTEHLAASVLNDGKIVSYRMLSRALKVHNNVAKRMLFEFHRTQNQKKPGSVHATYLIDGVPSSRGRPEINGSQSNGEDVHMQSSPFMSSAPQGDDEQGTIEEEQLQTKTVMIAREEDLEAAKSKFETVASIHIYSLQQSRIQNLQTLSECNRSVGSDFYHEDPLAVGEQYGVILNSAVRRRTARRAPGVAPALNPTKLAQQSTSRAQTTVKPNTNKPTKHSTPGSIGSVNDKTNNSKSTPISKTVKPAPLKREQSDIFKSFSKPKPQLKREDSVKTAEDESGPKGKKVETPEVAMKDVFDDDDDDDDDDDEGEDEIIGTNKAASRATKTRKDRENQLRKMMEDDDDDGSKDLIPILQQILETDYSAVAEKPAREASNDEEKLDGSQDSMNIDAADDDDEAAIEAPAASASNAQPPSTEQQQQQQQQSESTSVSRGRRRGRRKVMKKKMVKDEEGYLVTKEEAAWESFSEDEPVPTTIRKDPIPHSSSASSSTATAGGGKKKAAGGGGGQGNIMSFFGKK